MLIEQCETMFAGAPSSFFEKEVTNKEITFYALKGNDLESDGYISIENLQQVQIKAGKRNKIDKFVLKAGDVVLLARGQSMRCCLVTEEVAKRSLIATANFIVLRFKAEQKGEFLVSYLNSVVGKQKLNHSSISSSTNTIKSLSLGGLKKLEIPFPSLEKQQQIAHLFHANVSAQRATLKLIEEQKKTVEVKIVNLMQEA